MAVAPVTATKQMRKNQLEAIALVTLTARALEHRTYCKDCRRIAGDDEWTLQERVDDWSTIIGVARILAAGCTGVGYEEGLIPFPENF